MILDGFKARLYDPVKQYGSNWVEEIQHVLSGLRTQPNRGTSFTPFFMVYGSEAILPTDIEHGAPRIQYYDEAEAEASWRTDLDSKEEANVFAVMRHTQYEQQLRHFHDCKVKRRDFTVGTMVLRQRQDSHSKLQSP